LGRKSQNRKKKKKKQRGGGSGGEAQGVLGTKFSAHSGVLSLAKKDLGGKTRPEKGVRRALGVILRVTGGQAAALTCLPARRIGRFFTSKRQQKKLEGDGVAQEGEGSGLFGLLDFMREGQTVENKGEMERSRPGNKAWKGGPTPSFPGKKKSGFTGL